MTWLRRGLIRFAFQCFVQVPSVPQLREPLHQLRLVRCPMGAAIASTWVIERIGFVWGTADHNRDRIFGFQVHLPGIGPLSPPVFTQSQALVATHSHTAKFLRVHYTGYSKAEFNNPRIPCIALSELTSTIVPINC